MLRFWRAMNEVFGWLMIGVFGLVMLIGIWQVWDNYYLFSHSQTLDSRVLSYKPVPGGTKTGALEDSPITDGMVGWVTIDGTGIDYPIMQSEDNTHYLNVDPFGEYSLTGSIFLDSRSSPDLSDDFSIVYGHHMDYGRMFGILDSFLNEDYLEEHSTGTLMIGRDGQEVRGLRVFASMRVSARERVVYDLDGEHIRDYIRDNAAVYTGDPEGRILALSTCADASSVSRIVVFCWIEQQ